MLGTGPGVWPSPVLADRSRRAIQKAPLPPRSPAVGLGSVVRPSLWLPGVDRAAIATLRFTRATRHLIILPFQASANACARPSPVLSGFRCAGVDIGLFLERCGSLCWRDA